jgi:transposase
MSKRKRTRKAKAVGFDALEQISLNAAGIDVHAEEIFVAVPKGRDVESVRSFPTFTVDLHRLADWLESCDIETVAMESTGVYWIPLYEILEARGFEVCLVNARHLKNVSGRKTDVSDCQWIQQLHTYGLLRASFRPPDEICAMRALVRHRDMLIRYRSAHIQHMQKALQLMNLQLTNMLSDITGVTGMKIIRAIVAGERDPQLLASFRNNQCARTEEEIAKSLEGNYRREHLFALKQALELYDLYDEKIRACDIELEALYRDFDPPQQSDENVNRPPEPETSKRRKNQPHFDLAMSLYRMLGLDLTAIDGIDAMIAQELISEIGLDITKWPTVKHFTSWLGLCPNNDVSAGKVKHRGTRKTQNRANKALRIAAQSVARNDSAIGAYYRRMRAKHGPSKAITATAHKLARIIYHMLKYRQDYVDPGAQQYEAQQRERLLHNLQRKAARLGYCIQPAAAEVS